MAIVEVRPIERESWHGKKGKEAFARPVNIEALVDIRTGSYATGLSNEDRKRLEKETGYNLSSDYMQGKAHEFWSSTAAIVKLEHKTNIFDTSRPLDEIKVKIMKASDLVANSMKEYEEGKFPQALFVIFDETEEMEIRAEKATIKRQVAIESSKLSLARKAEIVQILTDKSVRKQSENFIDLALDDAVEEFGPQKVLELIKRDKTRTSLHALVLEAIHKNILRKDGASVYFMDDQLGYDLESTVDYFQDPKNQSLKAQILEKLN